MAIQPIEAVSRREITELAEAAADNQQPLQDANPFEPGSDNSRHFEIDYWARVRWLDGEESA